VGVKKSSERERVRVKRSIEGERVKRKRGNDGEKVRKKGRDGERVRALVRESNSFLLNPAYSQLNIISLLFLSKFLVCFPCQHWDSLKVLPNKS